MRDVLPMTNTKSLRDKVAVVTGAGRGIGAEIAKLMAAHGARVVVNDLGGSEQGDGADQSPAQAVVDTIKEAGGSAVASYESVSDWDGAHRIIEQALDEYGQLDCVVNNAGILRDVIFHKMTEADFDAVIAVHLKGSFNVSRAAATHFRKQIGGAFVHMTSTSGLIGNFGQANYSAAKLGVAGLSKSIALDMSRLRGAFQLHLTFRLESFDRNHPDQRSCARSAGCEDEGDDARTHCPPCCVLVQ